LFVPQIADRDDDLNVKPLVFHVVEFDWRDDQEFGRLQACICRKCGFTELYTKGADGSVGSAELFDTVAERLSGFDEPSRFQF
jgi:hypothetical protein